MKKRYSRMGLGAALIPWKEDFSFDEALFRKGVRNHSDRRNEQQELPCEF